MKFRAKRRSNFNPHSPCGERPIGGFEHFVPAEISIHTPLAGSDYSCSSDAFSGMIFQSTLPLRGATPSNAVKSASSDFNPHSPCGERLAFKQSLLLFRSYFNPHSPCGERPYGLIIVSTTDLISIHTPLAGSDTTTPACNASSDISIHTPLAGSDRMMTVSIRSVTNFNPHSPCGERLGSPVAGGTGAVISIHTPLAGSDSRFPTFRPNRRNFNPHSPCGERPQK